MKSLVTIMCRLIGECIVNIMKPEFPRIYGIVGMDDLAMLRVRYSHLPEEKLPVDWVAFGFDDRPFYEIHLGIPFQVSRDLASFQVGFHITNEYLKSTGIFTGPLKAFKHEGLSIEHMIHPATSEHMFVFPALSLSYEMAGEKAQTAIDHGVALYRFAYTMIRPV